MDYKLLIIINFIFVLHNIQRTFSTQYIYNNFSLHFFHLYNWKSKCILRVWYYCHEFKLLNSVFNVLNITKFEI